VGTVNRFSDALGITDKLSAIQMSVLIENVAFFPTFISDLRT
jgi:hypothetical protein